MLDLFQLPIEIRHMIYAECLVVGKVFPYKLAEGYDDYDDYDSEFDDYPTMRQLTGYDAPEVALLRVCKAIHLEAEPMLYQHNTFVLPAANLTSRFFMRSLHNDARKALVKSVEISFDALDLTRDDRELVLDEQLAFFRDDMLFPEKQCFPWSEDLSRDLHDAYKNRLGNVVWPRKASYILDHLQLDELVVDVTDASCIERCCPMRRTGLLALEQGFAKIIPKRLEFLGVEEAREICLDMITDWTARRLLKIPPCHEGREVDDIRAFLEEDGDID